MNYMCKYSCDPGLDDLSQVSVCIQPSPLRSHLVNVGFHMGVSTVKVFILRGCLKREFIMCVGGTFCGYFECVSS